MHSIHVMLQYALLEKKILNSKNNNFDIYVRYKIVISHQKSATHY